jgi:D-serine deaminase-like pyridoxal phosphate-dependent protein
VEAQNYVLENTGELISPALIYYEDIIRENTRRIVALAGGPEQLWPHVKSHKAAALIRLQKDFGITRFKCATVAEAEVSAEAGAEHILLAYPLVGPNQSRYLQLAAAYPQAVFYAAGDDYGQLAALAALARTQGRGLPVLIDVDLGMRRTGVPLEELEELYTRTAALEGLSLQGLHCYDGHIHDQDPKIRQDRVEKGDQQVRAVQAALRRKGFSCDTLVMGGSPVFPCRAGREGMYLSPGTAFIGDWGYYRDYPDLACTPGAALFTRVVSHPAGHSFTLDLGYKGIAADPPGDRGIIAGLPEARPLFQSEEHWVFSLPPDRKLPPIGTGLFVIPTHICPTSALYPEIHAAQGGRITGTWPVSARNRRITF